MPPDFEKQAECTVRDDWGTGEREPLLTAKDTPKDSSVLFTLETLRQRLAAAELKLSLAETMLEQERSASRVTREPELHAALQRIAEMEASRSWRITRPIRQVMNLVYVLRHRLSTSRMATASPQSTRDTVAKAALLEQVSDPDALTTWRRLLDVEPSRASGA